MSFSQKQVTAFVTFILLALCNIAASAQESTEEIYLPELLSPEELSQEANLPPPASLWSEESFQSFSLDDWSSRNGADITQLYPLVLLINKASSGTRAQTLEIYVEGRHYATYPVSTGREKKEKAPSGKVYRSTTPVGWFHPRRFSPNHYSATWKAPMPWAVFFNGGIAVHATTKSHYNELGRRASGGCVRLRHDHAKEVYQLIKNAGKGLVPRFTQAGRLIRDNNGEIATEIHYRTLIIVENSAN